MFSFFSSNPTKDKFAQILQAHLKKAGAGSFEYRKEDFSLRRDEQVFYMGNTFDSYCAVKEPHRSTILANVISIFLRKDEETNREEALSTVVAVVRESALLSSASLLWQIE